MAKLVVLITAQLEAAHQVGEAWQTAGAPGITYIESYGLRRLQDAGRGAEILTGMVSMLEILRSTEQTSLIVLTLVNDDALVEQLFSATERILGDMDSPNNGITFAIDVERTLGVFDHRAKK